MSIWRPLHNGLHDLTHKHGGRRSGYYAWLCEPLSPRAKANEKLTTQIREFYDQSMGIYGSPRIFCDLKETGVQETQVQSGQACTGSTQSTGASIPAR
jgi:hypothetical protein